MFGPKTRFMGVEPGVRHESEVGGGEMIEWINIPVLDTRKASWVEAGTVGAVLLGFAGVCWVLFGGMVGRKKVGKAGKKTQ